MTGYNVENQGVGIVKGKRRWLTLMQSPTDGTGY